MTKDRIEELMLPQIKEIISTWDSNGIIIETQFDFTSQCVFDKYINVVYQIIIEHGGHEINNEDNHEVRYPICVAPFCPGEGCIYCFFDPDYMSCNEAEREVINYMQEHPSME